MAATRKLPKESIEAASEAAKSSALSCMTFLTDKSRGDLSPAATLKRGSVFSRYRETGHANGHASDRPVVTALEAVKRSVRYFRLLGSFPSGT